MKIQNHKTAVWLVAIAAIGAAVVLLLWRTGVGESVKRESARLFDYEYIPNQITRPSGWRRSQTAAA